MSGKIILITGPMFSSKTTTLLAYARRYNLAKKNVVLVKYKKDTRYSEDEITSHDKNSLKSTFSVDNLEGIKDSQKILDSNVVLIDEGQFFPDIVSVSEYFANLGKTVVISCLNGNFKREPFLCISNLLSKAEEVIHLKAVCGCGEDAHFTKRKDTSNTEIEVIGTDDLYEPVCRSCYYFTK